MNTNTDSRTEKRPTVFSTASDPDPPDDGFEWYRGQVHVHTNHTDKTDAVQWYKRHGYDFVVVTDLNYATRVDGLKAVYDEPERFVVVPGIETSAVHDGTIHDVMGYGGAPATVQSDDTRSVTVPSEPGPETYRRQARLIAEAGGVPAIAHPNLTWAAGAETITSVDPDVLRHFEMITTEPGMNDAGGGGRPSTTAIWDEVLSTGRELYAIAADDAHHFDRIGPETRPVDGTMRTQAPALPGRTSVFVRARELSAGAVVDAIRRGDFYSVKHGLTLPIEFERIAVDDVGISLELPTGSKDIGWTSDARNPTRYRTVFLGVDTATAADASGAVGGDAEVLERDTSDSPSYAFTGSERYVRARVEGSDGAVAWTQPVFPDGPDR